MEWIIILPSFVRDMLDENNLGSRYPGTRKGVVIRSRTGTLQESLRERGGDPGVGT